MQEALDDLGGITKILSNAGAAQPAKLYASLGARLEYDHVLKRVRATAEAASVHSRAGG